MHGLLSGGRPFLLARDITDSKAVRSPRVSLTALCYPCGRIEFWRRLPVSIPRQPRRSLFRHLRANGVLVRAVFDDRRA